MTTQFEFEDNPDIHQMSAEEKADYLKGYTSGRDPKTGQFREGHSGNPKGRPRARTNLSSCLNKSFSQRTTAKVNGKMVSTTYLQLACDMVVQSSLAERDVKTIMKLLKDFGQTINLSEELPLPKIKPLKKDPSVEMIREAILKSFDEDYGINTDGDNDGNDVNDDTLIDE